MENEIIYLAEREIQEMRHFHSLLIEEMLNLAEQVKEWRATCVYRHTEKEYSHFNPHVTEFQGRIGGITLDLESIKAEYSITASTPRNILGHYKEKGRKCPPRLVDLFSSLESKYIQDYFEKVKSDMKDGLDEARRLIKKE